MTEHVQRAAFKGALKRWFDRNRKRVATLVLVSGAILLAGRLQKGWPRDVDVRFRLAARRVGLREASMVYWRDGEAVCGANFRYGESDAPPPDTQTHRARLVPGRYDVEVRLGYVGHVERIVRAFRNEGDSPIDIDLGATAPQTQ